MSNEELIAELNAELRSRDPLVILRKQIQNAVLDEIEAQLSTHIRDIENKRSDAIRNKANDKVTWSTGWLDAIRSVKEVIAEIRNAPRELRWG